MKMKNKKSQITIFIIVGIMVLLMLGIFMLNSKVDNQEQKKNPALQPIIQYIEQCIKEKTLDAIPDNGFRGGYFYLPEKSTIDFEDNLPYYTLDGEDLFPTKETFEQEMEKSLNLFTEFCINEYTFAEQGIEIEKPEINVTSDIIIGPESINVNILWELIIKRDDQITKLSSFNVNIFDNQLYNNIMSLQNIKQILIDSEDGFCVSCLNDINKKNNWIVNIDNLGNNEFYITITDQDYIFNFEPYKLIFVIG